MISSESFGYLQWLRDNCFSVRLRGSKDQPWSLDVHIKFTLGKTFMDKDLHKMISMAVEWVKNELDKGNK